MKKFPQAIRGPKHAGSLVLIPCGSTNRAYIEICSECSQQVGLRPPTVQHRAAIINAGQPSWSLGKRSRKPTFLSAP